MSKKIFSFLLAVIITLSLMPCAAVMAYDNLTLDTAVNIAWGAEDVKYYIFTPTADGSYVLYVNSSVADGTDPLYSEGFISEEVSGDTVIPIGSCFNLNETDKKAEMFSLKKDTPYLVTIKKNYANSTTVTLKTGRGFREMS